MGLRFRRRQALPNGDATAIAEVLGQSAAAFGCPPGDFDLAVMWGDLLDSGATDDLKLLAERGIDEAEFYEDELRPNWEGLSQGERASKIAAFARFANTLGRDDVAGLAPVVRTKLLVLAWAYDCTYEGGMLPSVADERERFGRLEPVA